MFQSEIIKVKNMKSRITKQEDVFLGKHLKLSKIDWVDEEKNERKWEAVERVVGNKIVSIVAITDDKKILFVSQFRPPVGKYVIEFPAGLCDQVGEEAEETAKRELQEETGYLAKNMKKLFAGSISAGLSSEYLNVFLARDLEFVGKKDGREERGIEVFEVSIMEVENWLKEKEDEGMVIDVKILGHLSYVEKTLRRD